MIMNAAERMSEKRIFGREAKQILNFEDNRNFVSPRGHVISFKYLSHGTCVMIGKFSRLHSTINIAR